MNPFIPFFILVIVVGGIIATLIEQRRLPEKRKRFDHRESISLKKIFANYYANANLDESDFRRIWNEVASILELEPQKLRPEDRFENELSPVKGYFVEDELLDLQEYLRVGCKNRGSILGKRIIETLDEFIKLLCQKKTT